MSNGWIKLHRQLLSWEWYDDINTSRLFIHLMITANHKDNNWRGIEIKRGSRLTSLDKLSSETSLSVSKIRTAIKKLISTNEIASKSHSQHTVFTMINYDMYQGDDKHNDKPVTNKSQANDKQIATNKNVKNDNNEKNKDLYQQIADEWNTILGNDLSKVLSVTDKRKTAINGCIAELKNTEFDFSEIETWTRLFNYAKTIPFLMGENKEGWTISFDFIITKNKFIKLVEGGYQNDN